MKFRVLAPKSFLITLLFSYSFGCITKVEIPEDVMSKEQMAQSMEALLIAEDITRVQGLQKDSSIKLFLGHYKPNELKKLGFTVAQFDSSYNFYIQNPDLLEEIMDSTEASLKRKVELMEEEAKEK